MNKKARAQLLKESQVGARWQTSQLRLDLDPQYAVTVTHQHAK